MIFYDFYRPLIVHCQINMREVSKKLWKEEFVAELKTQVIYRFVHYLSVVDCDPKILTLLKKQF